MFKTIFARSSIRLGFYVACLSVSVGLISGCGEENPALVDVEETAAPSFNIAPPTTNAARQIPRATINHSIPSHDTVIEIAPIEQLALSSPHINR